MEHNKYKLGETVYWVESNCRMGKSVECPICYGKRSVIIILGNGEQEGSQCGYCENGFDGPTGRVKVHEPSAIIMSGEITGISNRDGWTYELGYRSIKEHNLFKNEKDAEPEREEKFQEEKERSKRWFRDSFVHAKKKQLWSTGYHKRQIKDHERSIEWHKLRLQIIKGRQLDGESNG